VRKRIAWLSLILALICLPCCQPQPAPSTAPTGTAAQPGQPILEVSSPTGKRMLTLEEIQALPATEGWAGIKTSVGTIFAPLPHKGVLLEDLADLVGGFEPGSAVEIVAEDGYAMTMSYSQVTKGDFVIYDPQTGDEIPYDDALQLILAYEREGQPLPEDTDGTLRLVVVSEDGDQVTDGHWAVKWVNKITFKPVMEQWTLRLEGVLSEEMDAQTFIEGAGHCCHRRVWTDEEGKTWTGVPLWRLVGLVDDEARHQVLAYNVPLAEQGYEIEVIAADGYTVSFDSQRILFNMDIILAHLVDDEPLAGEYFPLRLVGPELEKSEMVGQVARIVLHLAEGVTPAAIPTPLPVTWQPAVEGAGLIITGQVEKELTWTLDELRAMQIEVQGHHFDGTMGTYQGAPLNELLQQAGVSDEAKVVVLLAVDGAQSLMPLALLRTCPQCVVGFDEAGKLSTLMPEMDCYFWIKDLIRIEIR
jgi:DMSO/TMAO reductase YedYZ molybdopterin-dependent catalytic subunit